MNLKRLYNRMTETEINQGLVWYEDAHQYAQYLADKYQLRLEQTCGIISALSPSVRWNRNKLEAEWLIQSNLEDCITDDFNFTTYGSGVIKAQRIYHDEQFQWFNEKTGPKTYNFYHNILNPTDKNYLTVDRHCYYTVHGEQSTSQVRGPRYRKIVELYTKTANKLNIIPNQLQAILWLGVQNKLI